MFTRLAFAVTVAVTAACGAADFQSDNGSTEEAIRNNTHKHHTVSDAGPVDTGGTDAGTIVVDAGTVTPPPTTGVARPAASLGVGYFVSNGEIYDGNGVAFHMRGINHTHWWGNQTNNLLAVDEFPKTKANVIRAVFGANMGADTPAEKRQVVERYMANHMPVVVEEHRGTCSTDPTVLSQITDVWLDPGNVSWLQQYEKGVILNIANEWGPSNATTWASAYESSIARLRAAGIHNLILVDAGGGCGQDVTSVEGKAQEILDRDPEHNTAFSIHMYGFWRTSEATDIGSWGADGSPWLISTELSKLKAAHIPFIVGETGWEGDATVLYKTQEALKTFNDLGVGFIAWSWNQNSDATYDLRAGGSAYTYNGPSDLTAGGTAFFFDTFGIQNTSKQSTSLP